MSRNRSSLPLIGLSLPPSPSLPLLISTRGGKCPPTPSRANSGEQQLLAGAWSVGWGEGESPVNVFYNHVQPAMSYFSPTPTKSGSNQYEGIITARLTPPCRNQNIYKSNENSNIVALNPGFKK